MPAKVVAGRGARLTLAGQETVLADGGRLTIDLKPAVGALAWGFWNQSYAEVKVPAKVVAADGGSWDVNLVFVATGVGRLVLAAVRKGPVAFSSDAPAPAKPRAAAYLDLDDDDEAPALVGTAGTMKDVDLIVLEKCAWKDLRPCGTYASSRAVKTIRRSRCTATVTAYDRRKGTVVASKQFDAGHDPECPKSLAATRSWVTSTPDYKTLMKPWVEGLLR